MIDVDDLREGDIVRWCADGVSTSNWAIYKLVNKQGPGKFFLHFVEHSYAYVETAVIDVLFDFRTMEARGGGDGPYYPSEFSLISRTRGRCASCHGVAVEDDYLCDDCLDQHSLV